MTTVTQARDTPGWQQGGIAVTGAPHAHAASPCLPRRPCASGGSQLRGFLKRRDREVNDTTQLCVARGHPTPVAVQEFSVKTGAALLFLLPSDSSAP